MFSELWNILKPFRSTFVWFVVLLVLYEGLQIVDSYVLSFVIKLFGRGTQYGIWITLIAGLMVYDWIFASLDNKLDWDIVVKQHYPIYRHLKKACIGKFLEMDMDWHQKRNSGTLVGKVNNGVNKVQDLLDGISWEFVPTLIQTLLSLIPLIFLSPSIIIVVLLSLGLFIWLTLFSNNKREKIRKERYDLYEIEWFKSMEGVQSVETLVMFNQEKRFLDDYSNLLEQISALGEKEMCIQNHYNKMRIVLLSWSRRLILVVWIWQLYQGSLSIANLVFVSILIERIMHSFWRFAHLFDRATEASEGVQRLIDLTQAEPSIIDNKQTMGVITPVGIKLSDVCFSYNGSLDDNKGTIQSLNLNVDPASIVALVGPSGAGKTTFRKIVTRLNDIQSGNIEVSGIDTSQWSTSQLRSIFSYVPQGDEVFIYSDTVRANIALPKPDASYDEITKAAELAGIHDFIMELEDGYDTLLGERGKRLSGGQKQRLALARAILADRPVLILDEATSAVDAITEKEIQGRMRQILKGKTAVIIAHRLSTIWDLADKIVVLDNGRKVEEGTHQQLMEKNGLYAKMVNLQIHS